MQTMQKKADVHITPEQKRALMERGLLAVQNISRDLSNINKTEAKVIFDNFVREHGGELFANMNLRDVLSLPAVYKIDPNKMVTIGGESYYILDYSEPKTVGRRSVINGQTYEKGQRYEGEVVAIPINSSSLSPVSLPYDVLQHITATTQKEATLQRINEKIRWYNARIQELNKATGLTRLALQLKQTENDVDERIATLQAMIASIQQQEQNADFEAPHESWIQQEIAKASRGELPIMDAFHTIMYAYQSSYQRLLDDLQGGQLQVPPQLRTLLVAMATQELRNRGEAQEDKQNHNRLRQERMETPGEPDTHVDGGELQEMTADDIPAPTVPTLKKFRSPGHYRGSLRQEVNSMQRDLTELEGVKTSLTQLRSYVGELEKGQRAESYLRTPEGQTIIRRIAELMEGIKRFARRYVVPLVVDGKINSKLMGQEGSMGNAMLVTSLNRILKVIYETIRNFMPTQISPEIESTTEPTPQATPQAQPEGVTP